MCAIRSHRVYPHVVLLTLLIFLSISCVTKKSQEDRAVKTPSLKVGDEAPDFSMRNQDQIKISLSEFKDKKIVVLVFYPADFTPV